MTNFSPVLAVSALALVLSLFRATGPWSASVLRWGLSLMFPLGIYVWSLQAGAPEGLPAVVAPVVAATLLSWIVGFGKRDTALASAALASVLADVLSPTSPQAWLAASLALAWGGAVVLEKGPQRDAVALGALVAFGANSLAFYGLPKAEFVPLGSIGLAVMALVASAARLGNADRKSVAMAVSLVAVAGSIEFLVRAQSALMGMASVGVLLVSATLWLHRRPAGSATPMLNAFLWLSAATVAFAQGKGLAMALVAVGAVAAWLVLATEKEAPELAVSLAPLLALVAYRGFREMNVEATRALDLGQHYALIGFLLGAFLPVLLSEAKGLQKSAVGALVGAAVMLIASVGGSILLGPKGAIGLLVGIALAGVLAGAGRDARLSLGAVLSLGVATAFPWLGDLLDLGRNEKNQVLVGCLLLSGILIALASLLAPKVDPDPVEATHE